MLPTIPYASPPFPTGAVAAARSRRRYCSRSSPRQARDPAQGAAGGHRDRRRRRGLPDQRAPGHRRDHRLLHADRRRSVRLRAHRRHQRDLRRLRHGRHAAVRAGAGRACRSASCRWKPFAECWKAASRSAPRRASPLPAATPSIRSSRSTDWSPSASSIRRISSATPARVPAIGWCSASRSASGVYSAALKKEKLSTAGYAAMIASTTQLNTPGIALGTMPAVHALTDVTGFGLLGHLLEICRASDAARRRLRDLPLHPGHIGIGA